jgi:hypothetical protein
LFGMFAIFAAAIQSPKDKLITPPGSDHMRTSSPSYYCDSGKPPLAGIVEQSSSSEEVEEVPSPPTLT